MDTIFEFIIEYLLDAIARIIGILRWFISGMKKPINNYMTEENSKLNLILFLTTIISLIIIGFYLKV
ncbi:hypothetical protein CLV96_0010 [Leptospira meyeri]|uniref:Uncharacterized protein n=1 Tax=Leptospira meyeri TaxID=29508 RepID=A0A4R8MVD9_LEPME|nr:hypothetical protein [Leptospira meyeri]TDY71055.1 hypothetical protein CLV96_0010 [Leptospira meyeri]